jgi:hypothetical protein
MALLRTPSGTHRYDELSHVADRIGAHANEQVRLRIRYAIALLSYSASYPLLGIALWRGAHDGEWVLASILVGLGVLTSFVGWGLLSDIGEPRERSTQSSSGSRRVDVTLYIALYNRVGAIVVLLESYTVAATSQGWPIPQTFTGWFALVWIPLFTAFVVPVERSSTRGDVRE